MQDKKIILLTLQPKTHRTSEENLGLGYLKSSLKQNGYEVEILDAWLFEKNTNEVFDYLNKEKDNILFIGISSYMGNVPATFELIKLLKNTNINYKIVCGGFGPTFYSNEFLNAGADYIIRGEGEHAICELAKCIENNMIPRDIKNIGYIQNNEIMLNPMECLNNNLDLLPFPSRDTISKVMDNKSSVNILTSRGCSGNCEFCSVISFFRLSDGKVWRSRSISNIVDEIEQLYKKGIEVIKVVDDSFIDGYRDYKWCKEFADEIEKRNIKVKLRGQIRADKVTDGIIKELKRAGFFSFACGIENGSQSALSRMNKKATLIENKRALEIFKKYGIIVQMGFILFDKETTLEELEDNYEFLKNYDYTVTKGIFSEMYSTEGTAFNERLKSNNQLELKENLCSNNKYELDSEKVKKVYNFLKLWQKNHSRIYDMTIDPITAPKNISSQDYNKLYECVKELKRKDLEIFGIVLKKLKEIQDFNEKDLVDTLIHNNQDFYEDINIRVRKIYNDANLQYNVDNNQFI